MNSNVAVEKILNCENLQTYCDYYSISVDQIKNEPEIAVYILEHQKSLEQMISGYNEMSSLNADISNEFQHCEQECQNLIR